MSEQRPSGHRVPYPGAALGGADAPKARRAIPLTWVTVTLLVVVSLLALGAIGGLGYVAKQNNERAQDWQARAEKTESALERRTRSLDRQTTKLNEAVASLRNARRAAARSEADVKTLEERQRELAAEKAAVEDERAAVRSIASGLSTCTDELFNLIATRNAGFSLSDERIDFIADTCTAATGASSEYFGR